MNLKIARQEELIDKMIEMNADATIRDYIRITADFDYDNYTESLLQKCEGIIHRMKQRWDKVRTLRNL